jgi:general nucleoside transport system ATP-binding protein
VVSQDIEELIKITSRIAVLSNGQLSKSYNTEDVTSEILGMEMGGARNS